MKILLVDDDPEIRSLFEEQIHALGYEVTVCPDATTALSVCQRTSFPICLLDLGLPDMDGIELCRRLRALPRIQESFILVVTGRDGSEDLEAVLKAGADDYLQKPVTFQELKIRFTIMKQRLYDRLRRRKAEKALHESLTRIERAKREWELSVDSLPYVVCLLDKHRTIIRTNRAIERWNLGKVSEVKGLDVHELFHPHCSETTCAIHASVLNAWERLNQGGAMEFEVDDAQLQRCIQFEIRPILSPISGKSLESFAVLVADDITQFREVQNILSRQERFLLGVAGAMNHLLVTLDFQEAILRAFKALSFAIDVDRIALFESHDHPDTGSHLMSQRFVWERFSGRAQHSDPGFQNIPYHIGLQRWYDTLSENQSISARVYELPPEEQDFLTQQNIMSILLVPITLQEQFWGFLWFDSCREEREWRDEEEALLVAVAGSISGAIARERIEQKLRQTSTELREVFQALPDEYFRLGADGSVLDYKVEAGSELFLQDESFMGKWASGNLPSDVEHQFERAMAQARETRKLISIEYSLPVAHQKIRYEEIRLLPILDGQLLVVARDITERKLGEEELRQHRDHLEELVQERTVRLTKANIRLQQEVLRRKQVENALRELNQQLEEASQHKSQFLARMSHELRTPLNAMIGYTSLTLSALKGSLSAKHLQNLIKAEQSARGLLQLINDVLDFSKIEAGEMDTFIEEIDLTEILEDVSIVAEGLLLDKPVEFQAEIASELPQITSDYTKIKQILNNLIGNAIKFTKAGVVTLRGKALEHQEGILIEVEDTGEGIPEDKQSQIFDSFKQADCSTTKRFGGTGLGLAITKRFCEMLGIELGMRSTVNKGTTFWLQIPIQAQGITLRHEETPPDKAEETPVSDFQSILLIDDDAMTLNLMEDIFSTHGYTVYTGRSGREGLQQASENAPDVILIDLVMPEMDGFETTLILKQDEQTRDIPVIACSAVATTTFQHKAKLVGCVGYITKPVEPEHLIEQVRTLRTR